MIVVRLVGAELCIRDSPLAALLLFCGFGVIRGAGAAGAEVMTAAVGRRIAARKRCLVPSQFLPVLPRSFKRRVFTQRKVVSSQDHGPRRRRRFKRTIGEPSDLARFNSADRATAISVNPRRPVRQLTLTLPIKGSPGRPSGEHMFHGQCVLKQRMRHTYSAHEILVPPSIDHLSLIHI